MQNKPNFRKAKMNVNIYYTKAYNNETASGSKINKPNSKPVLSAVEWANSRKAKMNVNLTLTKDYRKNDALASKKTNPNKANLPDLATTPQPIISQFEKIPIP